MRRNVQSYAVTRIADLFDLARAASMPSVDLYLGFLAIMDRLPRRTPRYVRAYLRGQYDARADALYRTHLVYGGWIGDTFYSTRPDRPDYYGKHGIAPAEWADDGKVQRRGHYWRASLRPYFVHQGSADA